MNKKRPYEAPQIEVHELDRTISLVMASFDDPGGDDPPFGTNQERPQESADEGLFISREDVFGGDRPSY